MTTKNVKYLKEILDDVNVDNSILTSWDYLMSAYHEINNFKYHTDEQKQLKHKMFMAEISVSILQSPTKSPKEGFEKLLEYCNWVFNGYR